MRESLRLIIVLGLIATISGGVLAYVHQTMSPIIEENRKAAMGEAILEVLPGAIAFETLTLKGDIIDDNCDSPADVTSSGSTSDATSSSTITDSTSGGSVADGTSGGTLADSTSSGTTTDTTTSSSSVTDATSGSTSTDSTSSGTLADTTSSGTLADGTSSSTLADATSGGSVDGTSGSSVVVDVITMYRGINANDNTTGIAFAVDGNGFGGAIRLMVGLDPATRELRRVKVLDHLETPGLGARITEESFLKQFENKSLDDAFTAKQDVDAITGATVSSQAVAATIKAALSEVEADLRAGGIW
jgi:RnfABCDGE-type electron transport complex G subunit